MQQGPGWLKKLQKALDRADHEIVTWGELVTVVAGLVGGSESEPQTAAPATKALETKAAATRRRGR